MFSSIIQQKLEQAKNALVEVNLSAWRTSLQQQYQVVEVHLEPNRSQRKLNKERNQRDCQSAACD